MQKAREKQGPIQQLMNSKGLQSDLRGGRGAMRGGGGAMRSGGYLGQVHGRKPYEKPVHAVKQPSQSGPIGAKDFAQYPEPLIGKVSSVCVCVCVCVLETQTDRQWETDSGRHNV